MMRPSYTSVVERRKRIDGTFHTHPYEAAWALEALFFLAIEGTQHPPLDITLEISPDGLHWTPYGDTRTIGADEELVAIAADHFGHWLRLSITGADEQHPAVVTAHLALKG